jgi:hypothetical protein
MPASDVEVTAGFGKTTLYVTEGGAGAKDGSSWANASGDLQKMMNQLSLCIGSTTPLIIKVGAGIYKPEWKPVIRDLNAPYPTYTAGGRDAAFILRNGVQVWGGYPASGGEDSSRNVTGNVTTLSGDLDGDDASSSFADNAYHVVLGVNIPNDGKTVLDGLKISGGYADEYSDFPLGGSITVSRASGGGMYNDNSSPVLTNVIISGNRTDNVGGGMYNGNGSSPVMNGGKISDNATDNSMGGGMYNENSSPVLTDVTISYNESGNGGGIYNISGSSPVINGGEISNNTASEDGGGIWNHNSSPTLTNVTIFGNTANGSFYAGHGGGIYNESSSPALIGVTISNNTAATNGGGMYNSSGSSPVLTGVVIGGDLPSEENTANNGGGIYNDGSSPVLVNVTISGNKATGTGNGSNSGGGGMYNSYSSSPVLVNVTISGNLADVPYGEGYYGGGGMRNDNSSPVLINVTISGNTAIVANDSTNGGGGMYNYSGSSPVLINVTIAGNKAVGPPARGGGMYNYSGSPVIRNSIIWGNTASASNPGIYSDDTPSIKYSMVEGESGGTDGNQSAPTPVDAANSPFADWKDPAVAPTTDGDYRLNNTGNADNAKNNGLNGNYPASADDTSVFPASLSATAKAAIDAALLKDLGGNVRKQGTAIDMGAYEKE